MTYLQKCKEAIKTKYKHLGLNEKVLETYAKKVAKRVGEDESKIDDEVADIEFDVELAQSQADQIRGFKTELEKVQKSGGVDPDPNKPDPNKPDPNKPDPNKPDPKGEEQPEWVKAMVENQNKILERFATMDKQETQKTFQQKLVDKLKAAEISEEYYSPFISGREFTSDEQIEEFANTLQTSHDAFLAKNNLTRLTNAAEQKTESVFTKVENGKATTGMSDLEKQYVENLKTKGQPTPATPPAATT